MENTKGIVQRVEGNTLHLAIDLNQNFGDSSTGKTIVVASSGGHKKLESHAGISFSLNVNKSKKA